MAEQGSFSDLPLDPEPFACYQAIVTKDGSLEDFEWERREVQRHARCHEGDVHFEPRSEYSQDPEDYPDSIWNDED